MKRSPKRNYTDLKKIIYLIAAVCCIVFLIFSLIFRKFADNVWINAIC